MADLLLVFVRPLPADLDRYPALFVEIGQPGFGLQVGVLLPRGRVCSLDRHVGLLPALVHVAFAHAVMGDDVAGRVGVKLRCALAHRFERVEHGRQVFVVDADQVAGLRCRLLRFGNDQRKVVHRGADDVCTIPVAAGPTQHRLIGHDQPVLVDWHILRRENCHHAGHSLCRAGVDRVDAGVGALGEQHLHVQHALTGQVAGVLCLPCDLAHGIDAFDVLADDSGCHTDATPGASRVAGLGDFVRPRFPV
jgi:hypothetical protein